MPDPVDLYRQALRKKVAGLDTVSLDAVASKAPPIFVKWYVNGQIIENGFNPKPFEIQIVKSEDGKSNHIKVNHQVLQDFCDLADLPCRNDNLLSKRIQAALESKLDKKYYRAAVAHWNDHRKGIEPQAAPVVAREEHEPKAPTKAATLDPLRKTVAQLGKDLGQMTPTNAKGSAHDVARKVALNDTVVTQRS